MKKKIINGLLLAVAMVAATSSFVSCKDYEGDNYAEFQEKYASLQKAYEAQVKAMQDYVLTSKYNSEVGDNYPTAKGLIKDRLQTLEDSIAAHANYGNRLNVLEDSSARYAQLIQENNIAIKKAQALADSDSVWIQTMIKAWGKDLDEAVANAARALAATAKVEADSAKWDEAYDSIASRSKEWNRAVAVADSAWNFVKGTEFNNLQELVDAYKNADDALQDQINSLNQDVSNFFETISKEVTGIEIQATMNPLYGTFAYPLGVQSNVLAVYYGESKTPVRFPAGDAVSDLNSWASGAAAVLSSELDGIDAKYVVVPAGIWMYEGADNAGKLYLTVNPSNVNFEGKTFDLRTSDNKVSKVVLSELEPCTEQLMWGYQSKKRANSPNGFYVANAQIKKEDAKDLSMKFEYSALKTQFKYVWENWKAASLADVGKLGIAVLNSLQTEVPRLGVQAQWKDTTGWKNYVSKYEIAAVSAKPLGFDSFNELDNQNLQAPIVTLRDKLTAKERAYEKEIEKLIAIQLNLPASTDGAIEVTTDGKVYFVIAAGSIDNTNPTEDKKYEITSLITKINSSIASQTDNIKTKLQDVVNKLIDKQNSVFDKAIAFLSTPSRYIQPALIAQTETLGFFYPSRTHSVPTEIKKGTKLNLYPTTLSAEIVAPAFKKYVAVVNAFDNDITKPIDAKQFNTGVFNTVVDGNQYDAKNPIVYTVDAPAGTILEIIYECLGYNGKVAGKKYYIKVYE